MIGLATVLLAAGAAVAAAVPTRPLFPGTFVAKESTVVQQTGEPVQRGTINSYWLQQATGQNRTSYHTEGTENWVVWEYTGEDTGAAYVVQENRCQYYCTQINLQCNAADSLCSYDYLTGAKYAGPGVTSSGQACDIFSWNDDLGPIIMNRQSLCVVNGTTPAWSTRDVCPFEKHIGWENSTYLSFEATTPPASAWAIPDKEYCNPGNDDVCQDFTETVRVFGPGRASSMLLLSL